MKNRKTAILSLVAICIILITILIITNISNSPKVAGWNDFKKNAIENYPFVKGVYLDSITPPDIRINYTLSRKIDMEEVDKIFISTKDYILSEKVFEDLQRYHANRYKHSFGRIRIVYTYRENNEEFECKIFSSQDVDGEPNHNNFSIWYIEYDSEPAKLYKE